MKHDCHAIRDRFSDYLDRFLAFHEREQIEDHLSACQACKSALGMTREIMSACQKIPEQDLPAGYEAAWRERLQAVSPARNKKPFEWIEVFFPVLRPAAVWGALGVVLLSLVVLLGHPTGPFRSDKQLATLSNVQQQPVRISMNEDLVLRIWFDAREAVDQGQFHIELPEGIVLVENGHAKPVHHIQWVGNLKEGRNLIPLPIRAVSKGSWTVTAWVEKGLTRKEKSIELYVNGA